MANDTYHYFGAYLEIKVRPFTVMRTYNECVHGHRRETPYCNECGTPVKPIEKTEQVIPTMIVDHLLGDEFEDVLHEVTPPNLYQTGVILAVGNMGGKCGQWLYLSRWHEENECQTKLFPTTEQIAEMVNELSSNYSEIIQALRESPHVETVAIKAGYVLDAEY